MTTSTISYRGYTIELIDAKPGSYYHTLGVKAVIDHGDEKEMFNSLDFAKQSIDNYCSYADGSLVDYSGCRIRKITPEPGSVRDALGQVYRVEIHGETHQGATSMEEAKQLIDAHIATIYPA